MVFRKPRAVFFLVLVVVLCSRPVRRVFVAQGSAEPRPQRSRMRSSPRQNDWKADSFESSRVPLEIGEHRPMIDGRFLEVGELVGFELFELYEFPKLIHVGIYAGRGDERLRNLTGVKSLSPLKHYVIEFSGPCQRSNSMISQVGLVIQGQGGQCIHIAELTPSFNWHMYEINSDDYGPPLSGEETLRRAVGQIGTQFGGYDVFGNNCQHFAVWARYNKRHMLPLEEQLQAKAGTMYQEIVDFKWVYANHELQKIMPEWDVQIQEKEKMWKRLQEVTEEKQEEEMEEMLQHLRWEVRILRIPEMLEKMRRRLQEEVGSTLGGYDGFWNNCQHFDLERAHGVLWRLERKLWHQERKLWHQERRLWRLERKLERLELESKIHLTLLQNQIIDSIDYSTI